MIEALESRQLMSLPSMAGSWAGIVAERFDGADEHQGSMTMKCVQQGKFISCTERDTFVAHRSYARGTIDARGRVKLAWSNSPGGTVLNAGHGRLLHGVLNYVMNPFYDSDGTTVIEIGFRVHRR